MDPLTVLETGRLQSGCQQDPAPPGGPAGTLLALQFLQAASNPWPSLAVAASPQLLPCLLMCVPAFGVLPESKDDVLISPAFTHICILFCYKNQHSEVPGRGHSYLLSHPWVLPAWKGCASPPRTALHIVSVVFLGEEGLEGLAEVQARFRYENCRK